MSQLEKNFHENGQKIFVHNYFWDILSENSIDFLSKNWLVIEQWVEWFFIVYFNFF